MSTLQMVFYHTKEILKGKGLRIYAALFIVSVVIMLYVESMQLLMDINGNAYMFASLFTSLINIVVNYVLLFLFIKAVRNEKFSIADIKYGCSKAGILIALGLLLSIIQIFLYFLCSFLGSITIIYLFLYTIVYTIFVVWNALIAFGVYDNANAAQIISGSIGIMKEHVGQIFMASLCLMLWYAIGQMLVPRLSYMMLNDVLYAGAIIPSIIVGASKGIVVAFGITAVNLVYYGGLYACLMPLYVYLAKIYNDERSTYLPSAKRSIEKQ